jgi:VWA domain-containing protein
LVVELATIVRFVHLTGSSARAMRLNLCLRHCYLVMLLVCSSAFSGAQTASQSGDGCLHRTLLVSVSDKSGPVMNLDKGNFLLGAKSLTVRSVKARRRPPRALILFDLSLSMTGSPGKLPLMVALARGFIDAVPPQASIALMTFKNRIKDQLDFSTPRDVIMEKLEELSRESQKERAGRTALFDALIEAVDLFGRPQPDDIIFLISDGGDNCNHARASTAKKRLLETGVRLYAFAPVEGFFPDEEVNIGPSSVAFLTQQTGGRSMTLTSISRAGDWDNSADGLARDREMGKYMYVLAASSYEVEIGLEHAIEKPYPLKLKLVSSDGKEMFNLHALYPREIMPCTNPHP